MKTQHFLTAFAVAAVSASCGSSRLHAYGAEGHHAVGSVAGARLAGTPTGARVKELLDGVDLGFAATIPDRIKSWDNAGGPDDPKAFKMPQHPKVEADLRAFWSANHPAPGAGGGAPSHHEFHYTDVPVAGNEKYADGTAGRSKWDIVHMITYCCRVLSGEIPEKNERGISRTVAVILLAHYVGDIHQPLHVGAEYFDNGKAANPDQDPKALPDQGGNTFTLVLVDPPGTDATAPRRRPKFHGFWDSNAVRLLMDEIGREISRKDPSHGARATPEEFDRCLENAPEPANWRPAASLPVKDWAEAWANDIMPVAREAHERLDFTNVTVDANRGRPLARGVAVERPGKVPLYANWAVEVVRGELVKGGWRLAAMLQKTIPLGPGAAGGMSVPLSPPSAVASALGSPGAAASPAAAEEENEDLAKAPEE